MYLVFWTLSYLTFSSMSNLPRLLIPFGLQHTLTPLQHPIHRACSSLLDFLMPSRSFNVQSAALAHPFWTSAYLNSASTSNPPCLLIPFGLPRAVSPLQRPIHRVSTSPTKGSRILRSSRRKAEVHRTSCAPVQKPGYAMFYPLIRLPLVHRKKGAKKLTLPHSLFPMDQRGVEPLSENPFPVLLLS